MRDSEDVSEVASDFHLDQTEFNLDQQIFSPCFSVILPFKVNTSIIKKKKTKIQIIYCTCIPKNFQLSQNPKNELYQNNALLVISSLIGGKC